MFGISAIIAGLAKAAAASGTAATTAAPAVGATGTIATPAIGSIAAGLSAPIAGGASAPIAIGGATPIGSVAAGLGAPMEVASQGLSPLSMLATDIVGGVGMELGTSATAGGVGAAEGGAQNTVLSTLANIAEPAMSSPYPGAATPGLKLGSGSSLVGEGKTSIDWLKTLMLAQTLGSGAKMIHDVGNRPATPDRQTGIVNAGNIRTRNEAPKSGPSANYFAQSGRGFQTMGNAKTWKALTTGDKPDPVDPIADAMKRNLRADRFVPGASSEMDRLLGVRTGNYVSEGVLKMLTSRGILDSSKGGNPMITNPYLRR